MHGGLHIISKVFIYTDGSFAESSSSWGLVVLVTNPVGTLFILGVAADSIATDSDACVFLGAAKHDNFIAEVAAVAWALRWVAQLEYPTSVEIRVDCIVAAKTSFAQWKSDRSEDVV